MRTAPTTKVSRQALTPERHTTRIVITIPFAGQVTFGSIYADAAPQSRATISPITTHTTMARVS